MKRIKILGIFSIVIILIFGAYRIFDKPYANLILKNDNRGEIKYLSIYKNGKVRKRKEFESGKIKVYTIDSNVFTPYISNNKVLNKLNEEEIKDSNGNSINNEDLLNILKLAEKLEHNFLEVRILEVNNKYFLNIGLNVNWEYPYEFYEYNKSEKSLKYLHTFKDFKVIGVDLVDEK